MTPEKAQELLKGTTPGPWELNSEETSEHDDLVQGLCAWLEADLERVFGAGLVIEDQEELTNLTLASYAPELAEIVAGMHYVYTVEVRYIAHEWAGNDWYPCDTDGNTRVDYHDDLRPWRWVGQHAWRKLESAQQVAEQERGWEDRNVRITRRLVADPEVVE